MNWHSEGTSQDFQESTSKKFKYQEVVSCSHEWMKPPNDGCECKAVFETFVLEINIKF